MRKVTKGAWFSRFVLSPALLAACGADGSSTRPRDAGDAESETGSDAGGTCSSCSLNSDCQNGCGRPAFAGYVWCCGSGVCYTWANACPPPAKDAGRSITVPVVDSGPPDDGGLFDASADCQPGGARGGHRWQDLYACYFGPTGNVSCGSATGCHSIATDRGALTSHFVCNPTSSACWQSLTTAMLLVTDGGIDPTTARLYTVLCKSDGSGLMPLDCPSRLWSGDMARIAAWIQQGAPNN
jgi:hypothetical protein